MYPQSLTPVQQVDLAFAIIFGFSVFVLLAITAAMLWFVWRYHESRHPVAAQFSGNVPAEIAWTVIPSIIVMGLFYYGWEGYKALRTVPEGAMEVKVTARMWSWVFEYPGGKRSSVLVAPVDTPVKLRMTSVDVLHSLFVPAFRIKMDTVPGMETYAWFKADRPGEYDLLCAEYCGLKHANMITTVKVVDKAAFDAWLASAEAPGGKGRALMETYGCISCHSLDGTPGVGPTFKDLYGAEREVALPDGTKRKVFADEGYLRRAFTDPNGELVVGYDPIMPSTEGMVPNEDMEQMLAWLMHGNEVGREEGRRLMEAEGCISCHSTDGSIIAGPTLKGLWNAPTIVLRDGKEQQVTAGEDYLRAKIANAPSLGTVKGYDPMMPPYEHLTPDQLGAMVEYIKSLGEHAH